MLRKLVAGVKAPVLKLDSRIIFFFCPLFHFHVISEEPNTKQGYFYSMLFIYFTRRNFFLAKIRNLLFFFLQSGNEKLRLNSKYCNVYKRAFVVYNICWVFSYLKEMERGSEIVTSNTWY